MKKLFWALMLCIAAVSVASCDELGNLLDQENPDEETEVTVCDKCGQDPCVCEDGTCPDCGKNPCECDTPNPEFTPLQPSEQKAKLASVGQKLMEKLPASEWESYTKLVDDFANSVYVSEDYDWGTMEEWFETELDDAYQYDNKLTISGNKYTTTWTEDIVILMANHTGLFTCTEDGVEFSEYKDGTKAVFTLNEKTYEAEIKSSGKVTEAIYVWGYEDTWTDWGYYDPETEEWIETEDEIDREEIVKVNFKIGVPEQIDINITENGSPLATVTMKFTPSFSKDGVDITTDSFSVQTTVSINGFEFVSEKIAYNGATGKAAVKTNLKKNGESLFSTSASADVKFSIEEETWENDYSSETYTYFVVNKAQNINMQMDIIGEIQVKGSCSDAVEAMEEINAVYKELDHYDWETGYQKQPDVNEAKRHLNNLNAKLNLNVYYDGKDTKQASVEFDLASYTDSYDDLTYYDIIPIIVFGDGSKYKIEEFFTESAFGELLETFEEFCESYVNLTDFAS